MAANKDMMEVRKRTSHQKDGSVAALSPGKEREVERVAMVEPYKLGLFTLAGFSIVIFQVTCEVGKQISNYSIQVFNGGRYPLPQTILVLLVELIKLTATVVRSGCQRPNFDPVTLRHSMKFLLPSLLYAINNNIYFAGLMLVPPPIWIILGSFRTVVTASLYKFILKREVSTLQFVGALLIVASIVVAKLGDVLSKDITNSIPLIAIVLAAVAACNSVGAAVYTESLFKAAGENFMEQQFWLYFYGAIVASAVHFITAPSLNIVNDFASLGDVSSQVLVLLVVALLFGSLGGLVVAAILKKLDNIVKEYSGATANMFTAIICSFMFPEKFSFTIYIFFAMVLLFIGIFLYETQKVRKPPHQPPVGAQEEEQEKAP